MTNYVAGAKEALYAALRAQGKDPMECLTQGLEQLYVMLVLLKGTETTMEDVHDAWACDRAYTRPDHPDLIPFHQLDPAVVEYDRPFMEAIHEAARQIGRR